MPIIMRFFFIFRSWQLWPDDLVAWSVHTAAVLYSTFVIMSDGKQGSGSPRQGNRKIRAFVGPSQKIIIQ